MALTVLSWSALSCSGEEPIEMARQVPQPSATATAPAPPSPAARVAVADEALASQLVEGFFGIENDSWRWTAKRFVVDVGVPPTANRSGATLRLRFSLPEAIVKANRGATLAARVGATEIPAQKFEKVGTQEFVAEVPAAALPSEHVRVEFRLDKGFVPGGADTRELGIVAYSVALEAK